MDRTDIVDIIKDALTELNTEWEYESLAHMDEDTPIFGSKSDIDSLGLVNLLVVLEQRLIKEYNKPVSLTNEKAFSLEKSPFLNISSLADYIHMILSE